MSQDAHTRRQELSAQSALDGQAKAAGAWTSAILTLRRRTTEYVDARQQQRTRRATMQALQERPVVTENSALQFFFQEAMTEECALLCRWSSYAVLLFRRSTYLRRMH